MDDAFVKYWTIYVRKPGKLNLERAWRLANEKREFRKGETTIRTRIWYYDNRYRHPHYPHTIRKGIKHVAYAYGQYVDD